MHWIRRIRESGLRAAAEIGVGAVRGKCFDWYHGTDTFDRQPLEALAIASVNKQHGTKYDPSPIGPFTRIVQELDVTSADGFVDFGCGKGRTLLQAAGFGFKRVVGVEFSGELCAIARRNVERFSRRGTVRCPIEVFETDAVQFPIEPDLRFFYFYNPFDAEVMGAVCRNIIASCRQFPRRAKLVYGYPRQRAVIERTGAFELVADHFLMDRHFLVFEYRDGHGQ